MWWATWQRQFVPRSEPSPPRGLDLSPAASYPHRPRQRVLHIALTRLGRGLVGTESVHRGQMQSPHCSAPLSDILGFARAVLHANYECIVLQSRTKDSLRAQGLCTVYRWVDQSNRGRRFARECTFLSPSAGVELPDNVLQTLGLRSRRPGPSRSSNERCSVPRRCNGRLRCAVHAPAPPLGGPNPCQE